MLRSAAGLLASGLLCLAQQTASWTMEAAASEIGYRLEVRREGVDLCAVILPPSRPVSAQSAGNLIQTANAASYRGKTVRLSAWLRIDSARPGESAQLWMRVNRHDQAAGLFDNLSDTPVTSGDWTHSEVTLNVNPSAETVSFGVLSTGVGTVWARDVSILVAGSPENSDSIPKNLRFTESSAGRPPGAWKVLTGGDSAPSGYKAETVDRGCHTGPPCAVLISPPSVPPQTWGALLQSFSAAGYRGRIARFTAFVRLQRSGKEDHLRLWLRTSRAGETVTSENLFEHMDYREFRQGDWNQAEIARQIDEDVDQISIGVMLMGKGRLSVDEVGFSAVVKPELHISHAPRPETLPAPIADAPPESPVAASNNPAFIPNQVALPPADWPSLRPPVHDEQSRAVNGASRRALTYIRDLPNFLCNLLIDRTENRGGAGWRNRDVLNVQLGFSDGTEHYKLTRINDRPSSIPYRSVGGAISEGDFGSVMAEIFRPRTAQFHWDHWTVLRGRVAHVFRYEMALEKSVYQLEFGASKGPPLSAVTAHHGYVYIERETHNILRIEQIADPPAGFPLRYASNIIDYDWNEVGGKAYLLPLKAEITMGSAAMQSINVVQFRDYRKFAADTQITFRNPDRGY